MPQVTIRLISIVFITFCFSFPVFSQDKAAAEQTAVEKLARALVAAKTDEERDGLLEKNKELKTEELQQAVINAGAFFLTQGNYSKALLIFDLALQIAESINYKNGIIDALNNIGIVHGSQGDYMQGLNYFQKSLALSEELKDKLGIANALNSIGTAHFFQADYEQALEYYQKCFKLREELNDKLGTSRLLNNIGNIYKAQSNFRTALELYHKSLTIKEDLKDKLGIAATLNNIGGVHQLQGNITQGLEYYQRSLAISEELKAKPLIILQLNNIGIIHRLQGNHIQALDYYQKSLALSKELNNKPGITRALNNLGNIQRLQRNYTQALDYYQKSLTLSEELNDKAGVVRTLGNLGAVHNLQGNFEQALKFADLATDLARKIGEPDQIWQARSTAGKVYRTINNPDQSRQAFDEAINVIETLRGQVVGDEQAKQFFLEDKIAPYHEMVALLIAQNNYIEALSYAERAKARVLLDVLQSRKVNITTAMTHEEREKESILNSVLFSLNNQIYRENQRKQPDKIKLADLENRLEKARLELEAFRTVLYATHPELKSKRFEVQSMTLDEAKALLPNLQSALLEFVIAEDKTYLFVITMDRRQSAVLRVYQLDIKREDLEKRTKDFRETFANKELGFRKPGRELYDMLLKPAEEQLIGKTNLIIVPEGPLWELPFQVLINSKNRCLLEEYSLFYAPSFTALREMSKPRVNQNDSSSKTLIAFGNPTLGKQTIESVKSVFLDENLEPLPAAEEQVKRLARLYGPNKSKFYIGPDAREENFKAEADKYRILQFATHGILNNASPMYSHLVLSQTDEKSNEDGLLEAWEIMQMDLNADLAVLAACETARGKVGAGEGMIGLSWALFVAGCPTTVVSQWKVEDEATKDLMLEFHRLLKLKYSNQRSRMTKAEALRLAALKLMKTGKDPHPFYWAGFVLVGNGY